MWINFFQKIKKPFTSFVSESFEKIKDQKKCICNKNPYTNFQKELTNDYPFIQKLFNKKLKSPLIYFLNKFLEDVEPKQFCACQNNGYKNLHKAIPNDYPHWKKLFAQKIKKEKSEYVNATISEIKKHNRPHKGNQYIRNKEEYIIEAINVDKWYFDSINKTFIQILFNLNLRIKKGDFVVIVGESGSGKTTLLNLIAGIDRPTHGQIIVANHNLIAMNQKQLTDFRKKYLSIIFQNYALITDLTARENVHFGFKLQDDARKRADIDYLIDYLSITEHKNKLPKQLSGGQQQRVSIAKSLAKNPEILFADEPTGAVDEKNCVEIIKTFKDINKKYKTTIVLITHNSLIAEVATKVVRVHKGKIISVKNQIPKSVDSINWKYY